MKFRKKGLNISSEIDLTPMIDVVFLLVIFFMVSTTFMLQPGIKITLPTALNEEAEVIDNIIITVTKEGEYYLNENLIEIDKLQIELSRIADPETDQTVVINADEEALHKYVVAVMDTIRTLNIKNFVISTKKADMTP